MLREPEIKISEANGDKIKNKIKTKKFGEGVGDKKKKLGEGDEYKKKLECWLTKVERGDRESERE